MFGEQSMLPIYVFAQQIKLANTLSTFSPEKPRQVILKWLPLDFRLPQNNHKSHCENEALQNVWRKMSFCVFRLQMVLRDKSLRFLVT